MIRSEVYRDEFRCARWWLVRFHNGYDNGLVAGYLSAYVVKQADLIELVYLTVRHSLLDCGFAFVTSLRQGSIYFSLIQASDDQFLGTFA